MVELRPRKCQHETTHDEKLGLMRISCDSQFTIPNKVGTSPDLVSNNTNTMSSQLNQWCSTPEFSPLLLSETHSGIHTTGHTMSSTTLPSLQYTKQCHSSQTLHPRINCWHRVQHSQCTAYTKYSQHRAQHDLSAAYTKYSIYGILHTPNTVSTEYSIHRVQHILRSISIEVWMSSPYSHDLRWPLNVTSDSSMPSCMIDCHQLVLHVCRKAKWSCPNLTIVL